MRLRFFCAVAALLCVVNAAHAQENTNRISRSRSTNDVIVRIRDEGLNRSQLSNTLSYLCDVIGPRLTGSPNLRRANEWTRDTLTSWGLTNAHLEPWGPFGRGWSLKRFSAQIIEPQHISLIAAPKAWSPGLPKPITANVVFIDAKTEADLAKYKGKLTNTVVLVSSPRDVAAHFEAQAVRLNESNLLRLANAPAGGRAFPARTPVAPEVLSNSPAASALGLRSNAFQAAVTNTIATNAAATNRSRFASRGTNSGPRQISSTERFQFAAREGAALIVTCSAEGDGGTFYVLSASTLSRTNETNAASSRRAGGSSAWSTNVVVPPQIMMATEDYNRLARMIQRGEKLKMAVEFEAQFHTNDLMAANTIAEIPGMDLKDEVVMIGGHLDSWHAGTGATDNGAGVSVAMEAVRILKALNLKPRRTIRVGLWTGEEEGLLGSTAYVREHFGYYTNITNGSVIPPKGASEFARVSASRSTSESSGTNRVTRKLIRGPEYDKLSVYFNLDNGSGKIRGVYMQSNELVRATFRQWLEPLRDLGAETLTGSNTGGTDHLPFDAVGLPGFQFIQDPIEYWTRTHHSNADVFERIQVEDLKQASVIMAAFIYNAAMADEKLPRKPIRD
jgi:carboxypeptidase Q